MTQNEIQAVARAVHGELSRIDAMKYLDMPDNTADRVAQAAIAALDAARGNAEPVAASRKWANALANIRQGRRSEPLCEPPSEYAIENALEWLKDALLASPTPLYAHPPADRVAQVVEWLRNGAMAPNNSLTKRIGENIAAAIERGEPFNG